VAFTGRLWYSTTRLVCHTSTVMGELAMQRRLCTTLCPYRSIFMPGLRQDNLLVNISHTHSHKLCYVFSDHYLAPCCVLLLDDSLTSLPLFRVGLPSDVQYAPYTHNLKLASLDGSEAMNKASHLAACSLRSTAYLFANTWEVFVELPASPHRFAA
jgi:hypothetical protein